MAITRILLLGTLLAMIYIAFPVLAATRHHRRVTHVHPTIYNTVPDTGCPANGGPSCSNAGPAPPGNGSSRASFSPVICAIGRRTYGLSPAFTDLSYMRLMEGV